MKATKGQLKKSIGKEVFIIPRGSLASRYSKGIKILSSTIKSVTNVNLIVVNPIGSLGISKIKLDGSYDSYNCGGDLFLSREDAENYLWREQFLKDLKYEINLNHLTYEDCRKIYNIITRNHEI